MPLVSNRNDIEVNLEWLAVETNKENENIENKDEMGVEKIRIWISDKKGRTKTPFATN